MIGVKPVFPFSGFAGVDRFLLAFVGAKMDLAHIYDDSSNPPFLPRPPMYADHTAGVVAWYFGVLPVLGFCDLPQIANSVVGFNPVDVVKALRWPRPIMDGPRHTVRLISAAQDCAPKITFVLLQIVERFFARKTFIPVLRIAFLGKHAFWPKLPYENACFWIKIEKLAQRFNIGQLFGSHVGSPYQTRWLECRETVGAVPTLDSVPFPSVQQPIMGLKP